MIRVRTSMKNPEIKLLRSVKTWLKMHLNGRLSLKELLIILLQMFKKFRIYISGREIVKLLECGESSNVEIVVLDRDRIEMLIDSLKIHILRSTDPNPFIDFTICFKTRCLDQAVKFVNTAEKDLKKRRY